MKINKKRLLVFLRKMKAVFIEDILNYRRKNCDAQKVFDAHLFSNYKGVFVLKLPIGYNAASFGIIFLGSKNKCIDTLKHEYGHRLQLKKYGFVKYTFYIAIPSVTANLLDRMGRLPYDYYGSEWEREADLLGEVERSTDNPPWPPEFYQHYRDLLRLFFAKCKKNKPNDESGKEE